MIIITLGHCYLQLLDWIPDHLHLFVLPLHIRIDGLQLFEMSLMEFFEIWEMEICKCITEGQSSRQILNALRRNSHLNKKLPFYYRNWKIYFLFTYIVWRIVLLGVVGRSVGFLFIRPSWRGILPTVLLPTPARYTFFLKSSPHTLYKHKLINNLLNSLIYMIDNIYSPRATWNWV